MVVLYALPVIGALMLLILAIAQLIKISDSLNRIANILENKEDDKK